MGLGRNRIRGGRGHTQIPCTMCSLSCLLCVNLRTTIPVTGSMHPEDPGVWRDNKGRFHVVNQPDSARKSLTFLQYDFVEYHEQASSVLILIKNFLSQMLFNANSGHSHCKAGVPCGGHAWSKDGLSWSEPHIPAFGTLIHFEVQCELCLHIC